MTSYPPISILKSNPHYFEFRGRPTILITSAEHYGMVINTAFDYLKYLDALKAQGFNHSRLYSGIKRERPGDYAIDGNSQAPKTSDVLVPWKRSDVPGALDGGNKYDVDQWDDRYFERLKAVVTAASDRGIELELVLHGPLHPGWDGVGPWGVCPLNIANNINGVGDISYQKFNSLADPKVVEYQDRFVRKMVTELNGFDNLHFEICNEPITYTNDDLSKMTYDEEGMRWKWQQHVADVVAATEKDLPNKHLVACDVFIGYCQVREPLRHVDLYTFHYIEPDGLLRLQSLNKPVGMNETGILTSLRYAQQAWGIVMNGAALYNMLDYSYIVGHEDGSYRMLPSSPGYAGPEVRPRLQVLSKFINSVEFWKMRPANELLVYQISLNATTYVLAAEGHQYAIYSCAHQHSGMAFFIRIGIEAPEGTYSVEAQDAVTGASLGRSTVTTSEGLLNVAVVIDDPKDHNQEREVAIRVERQLS